jgi:secreted trypsin-like serine protease
MSTRALVALLGLFVGLPVTEAITNGQDDSNQQQKFVVAWYDNQGNQFCTGSLISNQHVLTAASCFLDPKQGFTNYRNRDGHAVIGVNSLTNNPAGLGQSYYIAHITVHPAYNPINWASHPSDLVDLAVVRLETHVPLGQGHPANIIVLSSDDTARFATPGTTLTSLGWSNGRLSKTTPMMSEPADCENKNAAYWDNPDNVADFNRDYHVCVAGQRQGYLCAADGDRGAPLVVLNDQNLFLVGVFSTQWGELYADRFCEGQGQISGRQNFELFTRVSFFASWIQEHTGTILPPNYLAYNGNLPGSTFAEANFLSQLTPQRVEQIKSSIQEIGPINQQLMARADAVCLQDQCQGQSASKSCWCDEECTAHGDCCFNYNEQGCKARRQQSVGRCRLPTQELVCGYKSGDCWCDTKCVANNDCCVDYAEECGVLGGGMGSCLGKCGGKSGDCWCDANCQKNQDCCNDFHICTTNGASADQKSGSCFGNCGHNAGLCWCDPGCIANGDCCSDFDSSCGKPDSCAGHCGHEAMTIEPVAKPCWCDASCRKNSDCCADFNLHCPQFMGLA